MSVLTIFRVHQYPLDELKQRIDAVKAEIEKKFEFRSEWKTDRNLMFRRKGLSGNIAIDTQKFELTLRPGLMYRAMMAEIKKEVLIVVDEHFPDIH
ncbi:MAG: hypothetical protein GY820_04355 [Gammaproteobacteria bacterium]|nr:hypothetical protein [Gammaproteobacteria bacterium]